MAGELSTVPVPMSRFGTPGLAHNCEHRVQSCDDSASRYESQAGWNFRKGQRSAAKRVAFPQLAFAQHSRHISLECPQGNKIIRKEDHCGIIDCYIRRVENGKYEVKRRITA